MYGVGFNCKNCASGYYKRDNRCFREIPFCRSYSANGYCENCELGYERINGLCTRELAFNVDPECNIKNEYGCIGCNKGFFLTPAKECEPIEIGCLRYFHGQCQLCRPGFDLFEGKCRIDGCLEYGRTGCRECASSYDLVSNVCRIANCLKSRNGVCLACDSRTRLQNGRCVQPSSEKCNFCAEGYFVNNKGNCVKEIIGCERYDHIGRCKDCRFPFVSYKNSCVIPGCKTVSEQGCVKCYSKFTLTSGLCEIQHCLKIDFATQGCSVCQNGYHLEDSTCASNHPLCLSYSKLNSKNQVCNNCVDGYILNDSAFKCEIRQPGCVYQRGKCISCEYPFQRKNGKCVIEGCSKYGLDECVKCIAPYKVKRGNCVIENCETVEGGKCLICHSGYHPYEGQCFEDDPKCEEYYYNKCAKCYIGHSLNRWGKCVRTIENCKVIGKEGCEECKHGYKVHDGECILTDHYCKQFSKLGCQECTSGYHT